MKYLELSLSKTKRQALSVKKGQQKIFEFDKKHM